MKLIDQILWEGWQEDAIQDLQISINQVADTWDLAKEQRDEDWASELALLALEMDDLLQQKIAYVKN